MSSLEASSSPAGPVLVTRKNCSPAEKSSPPAPGMEPSRSPTTLSRRHRYIPREAKSTPPIRTQNRPGPSERRNHEEGVMTTTDKAVLVTGANRGIGQARVEEALTSAARRG